MEPSHSLHAHTLLFIVSSCASVGTPRKLLAVVAYYRAIQCSNLDWRKRCNPTATLSKRRPHCDRRVYWNEYDPLPWWLATSVTSPFDAVHSYEGGILRVSQAAAALEHTGDDEVHVDFPVRTTLHKAKADL